MLIRHKTEINGFFWSVENFIKETNYIPIFHLGDEEHFSLKIYNREVEEVVQKLRVGFVCFLKNVLKCNFPFFQADYITCVVVAL